MRLGPALGALTALALGPLLGTARAQGMDEFGAYGDLQTRGRTRSPQEIAFEARFGQYPTRIDDGVAGSPYSDTFGTKKRWQGGAELDWQIFRIKNTLSLGPGIGFALTNATAKAPLADGTGDSAQNTKLNILPFFGVAVLRLDALADRTVVPIAPYAKLGFGYALWWSVDGEKSAHANGIVGRDTSYGFVTALGLVVRLDWLDPADAAAADAAIGLNHSGLFAEWFHADLGGLGAKSVMDVGTSTWVAGLTLEM